MIIAMDDLRSSIETAALLPSVFVAFKLIDVTWEHRRNFPLSNEDHSCGLYVRFPRARFYLLFLLTFAVLGRYLD